MKQVKNIFFIFAMLYGSNLLAQNSCDWSVIDEASQNFENGNFNKVITKLEKCTNSGFDNQQRVQAYRLMAKTYLAMDKDSSAIKSIEKLLQINPQFQPDLLSDNSVFIEILLNLKEKSNDLIITSVSKKAENINEAPATVVLVTEKQLKNRGYLDLEAVMHDLVGFDISRSNGNLYSHVYQRGYRSINTNRTLFLVDGVEENDLWSSNVYLSRQYAMSNIKNIEVVYGPASTMYGSNAFLGVVNVITKSPTDFIAPGKFFGVDVRAGYGSYNTKFIDGTIAAKSKSNNVSMSITTRLFYSDEQDLSEFSEHDFKPAELSDDLTAQYHAALDITTDSLVTTFLAGNSPNGEFYNLTTNNEIILTDAGIQQALDYDNDVYNNVVFADQTETYSIDAKLQIYDLLIGWNSWRKTEGPGAQYTDLIYMNVPEGHSWRPTHNYFYIKYDKDINSKLNVSNFLRYKMHDFEKENGVVVYPARYAFGSFGLDDLVDGLVPSYINVHLFQKSNQLRNEFKVIYQPIPDLDIIAGVETRFSSIQGDYNKSSESDAEENGSAGSDIAGGNNFFSRDIGIYAQTGISLIRNLKISLGLRYDNNLIRESEGYGSVFNPRAAFVFTPNKIIIKVIYAEAFKDATNRERYSTSPGKRELANPNLEPEKVKNYEFVVGRNFFDEKLNVNASAYLSQYDNIIQEVQVLRDDGTFTNQNQAKGEAEIYGINAFANFKFDNFSAYSNYTYTAPYMIKPTDDEREILTDADGNPYDILRISDIADHQINFGVNYLYKEALNINLRTNIVGARKTGEDTTVPTNPETFNSYAVLNGTLTYYFKKYGLSAQLTAFNLLNTDYYSPGLDYAIGDLASKLYQNKRNVYLSFSLEF